MRIAIGGSAANPPHLGHLMLLNYMMTCNKFDVIVWIPSGSHRDDKHTEIDADHRIAMTELLIPKEWRLRTPRLVIHYSAVYEEHDIPSFDILEMWKQKHGEECSLTWYTGTDSDVSKWHKGQDIIEKHNVMYIPRKGYCSYTELDIAAELPNISSNDIRLRISENRPFEHLVTPEVAEYIHKNKLYKGE